MNDVYFQHEQRSDMNNKRNAGMSKGEIMNRLATSKEDILAASRELIKEGTPPPTKSTAAGAAYMPPP